MQKGNNNIVGFALKCPKTGNVLSEFVNVGTGVDFFKEERERRLRKVFVDESIQERKGIEYYENAQTKYLKSTQVQTAKTKECEHQTLLESSSQAPHWQVGIRSCTWDGWKISQPGPYEPHESILKRKIAKAKIIQDICRWNLAKKQIRIRTKQIDDLSEMLLKEKQIINDEIESQKQYWFRRQINPKRRSDFSLLRGSVQKITRRAASNTDSTTKKLKEIKNDVNLSKAEKKALHCCLFEKKLQLLLTIQSKKNFVNRVQEREKRFTEVEICGMPINSNKNDKYEIDTSEKQQVREYMHLMRSFNRSNNKESKIESLSKIIDYFCAENSPNNALTENSRSIADEILKLTKRQLEIIRIEECQMKNIKNLNRRVESLLYRYYRCTFSNVDFNPKNVKKNLSKKPTSNYNSQKNVSYNTNNKANDIVKHRVWMNSSILNNAEPAVLKARWNRFSERDDDTNLVYFGCKDQLRAHKAFVTPDQAYSKEFIEKIDRNLQRASRMLAQK